MNVMNPDGLSQQAEVRLASGVGGDLPLPDFTDPTAVRDWRSAQHRAWGEDLQPGEPPVEPHDVGGIRCLVGGSGPTLVYAHGGGFCLGSPGTALPITSRLAARNTVVSVDYRLAPEHRFPAAIDDLERVIRVAVDRVGDTVAVGGDSAGGGLAVAAARRLPDLVRGLVLFSPVLDLRRSVSGAGVLLDEYVGDADRSDPELSVLAAPSLVDLPPCLLQVSSAEATYSQALEYERRTAATTVQVWGGLSHGWHYHRELPEAWDAVDRAAAWVAARS